jgi:hypothetical protein
MMGGAGAPGRIAGAAVVGWVTMTAALEALAAGFGGTLPLVEAAAWGAAALLPSGLAGWLCAAAAGRSPAATWPLAAAPGLLLAAAAVVTGLSATLGRMPWDHPKAGPLLIAGLFVLSSGPTFLAGLWARWVARPADRSAHDESRQADAAEGDGEVNR